MAAFTISSLGTANFSTQYSGAKVGDLILSQVDTTHVFVYDISSGTASKVAEINLPTPVTGTAMFFKNGYLLLGLGAGATVASYTFDEDLYTLTEVDSLTITTAPFASNAPMHMCEGPANTVFVALWQGGVAAINVNPVTGELTEVSKALDSGNTASGVAYDGTYVYLTAETAGISAFSYIANVLTRITGTSVTNVSISSISCDGGFIFACGTNSGVSPAAGYTGVWIFNGTSFTLLTNYDSDNTSASGRVRIYARDSIVFTTGNYAAEGLSFEDGSLSLEYTLATTASGLLIAEGEYFYFGDTTDSELYGLLAHIPVIVLSQPISTLFVPVNSAKAFVVGIKTTDDIGTTKLQITNFKGRPDYQDVLKNGG